MIVLSFDYLSISHGIGAHADRISAYEAQQAKKVCQTSKLGLQS